MIYRALAFASTALLLAVGLVFAPKVDVSVDLGSASGSFDVKPADLNVVCPGPLFVTVLLNVFVPVHVLLLDNNELGAVPFIIDEISPLSPIIILAFV